MGVDIERCDREQVRAGKIGRTLHLRRCLASVGLVWQMATLHVLLRAQGGT